jgi:hypothetical protein
MRTLFVSLLLAGLPALAVATPTYYVHVINDARSSVSQIFAALPDGLRWEQMYLDRRPLPSGNATTLGLHKAGGCKRDLRFDFSDGRQLTVRNFDICSYRSLHLGAALNRAR